MGNSVNEVTLVGRVGKDPEVRYTQSGKAVCSFTMATSQSWTKDGQKQERTEWHRLTAWEKTAEIIGEHVHKGKQLYVRGSLQTREWTDKEGVVRYTTEIVVQHFVFLGKKDDDERSGTASRDSGDGGRRDDSGGRREDPAPRAAGGPAEEDIPF